MDPGSIAAIIVSVVAAAGAYASQRAAAKAAKQNTESSGRMKMEDEAYDRAREYDTETIERQGRELIELRTERDQIKADVKELKEDNERLHDENRELKRKLELLESQMRHPSIAIRPETREVENFDG